MEDKSKKSKQTRKRKWLPLPKMGGNLTKVREMLKLTQKKLSEELNLSITSVSRMENDQGSLTFCLTYYLLKKYQVNPLYLMKEEEPMFLSGKKNNLKEGITKIENQELIPKGLGKNFKTGREALGLSQPELSKEIGLSVNFNECLPSV